MPSMTPNGPISQLTELVEASGDERATRCVSLAAEWGVIGPGERPQITHMIALYVRRSYKLRTELG